jgi:hypothetical protein
MAVAVVLAAGLVAMLVGAAGRARPVIEGVGLSLLLGVVSSLSGDER